MPSNSVVKLGVRWPVAGVTAVLDIKVTGAGASDTSWKKMSDDSAVSFPLNVTSAAQPYIYTNNPGSYDISFKVNGVELAGDGNVALVRRFNLGEGFIFKPTPRELAPLAVVNLATSVGTGDDTVADVGAAFNQTTLNNNTRDLADKIQELRDALATQGFVN
jgi:hypothetical protein